MQIELPPSVIYPDSYGTVRSGGLEKPFPAAMIARMIEERDAAYARGHWQQMVGRHAVAMKYNRPIPYAMDSIIGRELALGTRTDAIMLRTPELNLTAAWAAASDDLRNRKEVDRSNQPKEFSGNILTPFAALAHWMLAKGAGARVSIRSIGISPTLDKLPALKQAMDTAEPGQSEVDLKILYYTGQDSSVARIYLGTITVRVSGVITKSKEGGSTFEGVVKAYADKYDANASSHRGGFDEAATTALREVGKITGAQDYEILIEGELPLSLSQN